MDIKRKRSLYSSTVSEANPLEDICCIFGPREKISFQRRSYLDAKKIL